MVTFSFTSLMVLWGFVALFNAIANNMENILIINTLLITKTKGHLVTYMFKAEKSKKKRNIEVSIFETIGKDSYFFELEPGVCGSIGSFIGTWGKSYKGKPGPYFTFPSP